MLLLHRRANAKATGSNALESTDEGFVLLRDVVIATDRPIREFIRTGTFAGRAVVSLRLNKAMIQRWVDRGVIDSDRSQRMLIDHGSGGFFGGNRVSDIIGRWLGLRIEERSRKGEAWKALVGDAAFDPTLISNQLGPDWQGPFERRTIRDTSVGIHFNKFRETGTESAPAFEATDWDPIEGSFVWAGRDTSAGVGRSMEHDDMTSEELEVALKRAAKEGAERALAGQREATELVAITEETTPSAAVATLRGALADAGLTGRALVDLDTKADESDDPAEVYAVALRDLHDSAKNVDSPPAFVPAPTPTTVRCEGGDVAHYRALADIATMLAGRPDPAYGNRSAALREHAVKAAENLGFHGDVQGDIFVAVERWGRSAGIIGPMDVCRNSELLMEKLVLDHKVPDQAHRHTDRQFQGLYLTDSERGMVPAEFPSLIQRIIVIIVGAAADDLALPIERMANQTVVENFNEDQDIGRWNVLVPNFNDSRVGEQETFERAVAFDEKATIRATPHGVAMDMSFFLLWRNNAQTLVEMPATFGRRWQGAKNQQIFSVISGFTGFPNPGAQDVTEPDFIKWTGDIRAQAKAFDLVETPEWAEASKFAKPVTLGLRPNFLLYGQATEANIGDAMAGRQMQDGFATRAGSVVATESDVRVAPEYAVELFRNSHNTDYNGTVFDFALVTIGVDAALTVATRRGYQMRTVVETKRPADMLESLTIGISDSHGAKITQPKGIYRRKIA